MKLLLLLFMLGVPCAILAQKPHKNPDHVKGNSARIYEALPFYNEACEYYEKGDTNRAKYALYEAINTSFALTEAHLFLADIFREQGITDSAFYFYNSGIDFAIEQDPNYYFKLFETGMLHGQYDFIRHNLKHFNKLYGKLDAAKPYEDEHPYDRSDYDYYNNCIDMMYDFKSWQRKFGVSDNISAKNCAAAMAFDNKILLVKNGRMTIEKQRRNSRKRKSLKGAPSEVTNATLSSDGSFVLFTQIEMGVSQIFIGNISGNKLTKIKRMPPAINDGNNSETPYLHGNNLYFSSDKNGDYDLYVATLSEDLKEVLKTKALDRVNSEGDDTSPYVDVATNTFYFASNGHLTFGGFDIFECTDYETVNGVLIPINPRNPGVSFNSYHDELQLSKNDDDYLLYRAFRKGGNEIQLLTPLELQDQIYFEITPKEMTP